MQFCKIHTCVQNILRSIMQLVTVQQPLLNLCAASLDTLLAKLVLLLWNQMGHATGQTGWATSAKSYKCTIVLLDLLAS
jgi:hypothetical protein